MRTISKYLLWILLVAISFGVTVGLLNLFLVVLYDLLTAILGICGVFVAITVSIIAGCFSYTRIQARLWRYLPNF